jgi:hypothetical protein
MFASGNPINYSPSEPGQNVGIGLPNPPLGYPIRNLMIPFRIPPADRGEGGNPMPGKKATANHNLANAAALAPRCHHVRYNGQSCGAPARTGSDWCMFHGYDYENRFPISTVPEDASTIQLELARVIRQLQNKETDTKAAALTLYALQIASQNLKRLGAEMPALPATSENLLGDMYRLLDPLPEHAALAYCAIKQLIDESKRPYDVERDGARLDSPAHTILGGKS